MKHSSSPAYSIAKKYPAEPDTTNKHSPSPLTYNTRKNEIIVPSSKFSKAPRAVSSNQPSLPGPGAYPISTFVDLILSGKKGKRKNIFKERLDKNKSTTPGPGSYDPIRKDTKISYSIGNKIYSLSSPKDIHSAGPADYSPKYSSINPAQSISFTQSERYSKNIDSSPGPFSYNSFIKSSSPVHSFSRDIKIKPEKSVTPAPNSYLIPGFSDKTDKGVTIKPKREARNNQLSPGPGYYNSAVQKDSPSYSIGNGERSKLYDSGASPGPGMYSFDQNKSQGKSIGKGSRPEMVYDNQVPGPGKYETKSFIDIGPKYPMVGKKVETAFNDDIGPGKYSPNYFMAKAHSFCANIGRGKNRELFRVGPGPGAYDIKDRNESPEWSFKKGVRVEDVTDKPGPGHYEYRATVPDIPGYVEFGRKKRR